MRTTDRELPTAAILMAVIGLSTLVGGIIMLLPAHSGQAQPRLSHLTIPDVAPELDRLHLGETATYRDLKDPIRQECADPTPHSEEKPRDFYVTVAEGDRQRMLAAISFTARINESLVQPLYDGHQISYHDGWETWLEALNPPYTGTKAESTPATPTGPNAPPPFRYRLLTRSGAPRCPT